MQGFLLGLANGTTCLAYCAPVLVPFLLGEGRGVRQNWAVLAQFLGGRLGGYLLFALLAWLAGRLLGGIESYRGLVFGSVYICLAALLVYYGLRKPPEICAGASRGAQAWLARWPALLPLGLGFLTGLNLCPPFLLAFTGAASARSLLGSLLFFATFFIGTSLYFLPFPFLGALRGHTALRTIGRLASALVALYYLVYGIILLAGGIASL
jgi:hypothetical protein